LTPLGRISNGRAAQPRRGSPTIKRPIGSFIFSRSYGRRKKRKLARALAEFLFDDEKIDDSHRHERVIWRSTGVFAGLSARLRVMLGMKKAASSPNKFGVIRISVVLV